MLGGNSYESPIHTLSFSSDGRFLASINDISRIVIWSTKVSIINLLVIKFPWNLNFTLFLNVHSIQTWLPVFSCLLNAVEGDENRPLMSWMYSDPSVVATYKLAGNTFHSGNEVISCLQFMFKVNTGIILFEIQIQLLEGAIPNPTD